MNDIQNKDRVEVINPRTNEVMILENDLLDLVEGINYICDFYRNKKGFDQNKVLDTFIKVREIERLRGFNTSQSFSIDSVSREQVFELVTREMDNG